MSLDVGILLACQAEDGEQVGLISLVTEPKSYVGVPHGSLNCSCVRTRTSHGWRLILDMLLSSKLKSEVAGGSGHINENPLPSPVLAISPSASFYALFTIAKTT